MPLLGLYSVPFILKKRIVMSSSIFPACFLGLLRICSTYAPQRLGEMCDATLNCESDLTCTEGYCNRALPEVL